MLTQQISHPYQERRCVVQDLTNNHLAEGSVKFWIQDKGSRVELKLLFIWEAV